ncbi:flavin-containing amine oxidase [Penicillium longicatenatum]|uniref:flavin-containing amine oxidase n=1 Tax=Penicillium longicatenatum TaxID=1561947 RepID=UPI0025476EF0|nr:flavin-containing amine oxidase [Penicillium longicatenatum]KAJ5661149.1 flavin-containing amine oxidase [Penicillium longicatenatum]
MTTKEGHVWTAQNGLRSGFPCLGAINPVQLQAPRSNEIVDTIVIGSGYAGLVAARDLTIQGQHLPIEFFSNFAHTFRAGKSTFLVEARDRIGGRTWNGVVDGFNYEMGGTWIHWQMPHIYREISLYGMHDELIVTQGEGGTHDYFTLKGADKEINMSHEEELTMFGKVWGLFCNVDGVRATAAMPYPFDSMYNREVMEQVDRLSCKDRLDAIRGQLTEDEAVMLEAILHQMGGGPLDKMGLLDAVRWWALGGWAGTGINDIGLRYRLRNGQSSLAKRIFDHALGTGKLSYVFSSPIAHISQDMKGVVSVTSRAGTTWKARHVICTIPLNVLGDISFSPQLSIRKQQAFREGSTNHCNKVHFDVAGEGMVAWTNMTWPGKGVICAIADNCTPAGDTHLVAFGPAPTLVNGIQLKDGIEGVTRALEHVLPEGQVIKRVVYHDWNQDEFAKGTWCYLPPNFATRYLDDLRRPHGNVFFANADWSDGWRGWIDGAVEQGTQVALRVVQAQSEMLKQRNSHL